MSELDIFSLINNRWSNLRCLPTQWQMSWLSLNLVSCESDDSMYWVFQGSHLLVEEIAWRVCLTREPCNIRKCKKKKINCQSISFTRLFLRLIELPNDGALSQINPEPRSKIMCVCFTVNCSVQQFSGRPDHQRGGINGSEQPSSHQHVKDNFFFFSSSGHFCATFCPLLIKAWVI